MGDRQRRLTDPLDDRIAFTTSDAGTPHGDLVLAQFVADDDDDAEACTAECARRDSDPTIAPTTADVNEPPRKWFERIGAVRNLGGR